MCMVPCSPTFLILLVSSTWSLGGCLLDCWFPFEFGASAQAMFFTFFSFALVLNNSSNSSISSFSRCIIFSSSNSLKMVPSTLAAGMADQFIWGRRCFGWYRCFGGNADKTSRAPGNWALPLVGGGRGISGAGGGPGGGGPIPGGGGGTISGGGCRGCAESMLGGDGGGDWGDSNTVLDTTGRDGGGDWGGSSTVPAATGRVGVGSGAAWSDSSGKEGSGALPCLAACASM